MPNTKEIKKCSKCGQVKPISEFNKRKDSEDGYRGQCNECRKQYNEQWCRDNKERKKQYMKQYYKDNIEHIKQYQENNKEHKKQYFKLYRKDNKEYLNQYQKQYYNKNIHIKISHRISIGINNSLKNGRNGHYWENLLGFTVENLKKHLESQFKKGMSWDNYGRDGWSIDHIRPVSSFNFTSYKDKEFKECWALNNLQPLWHEENLSKGTKYE